MEQYNTIKEELPLAKPGWQRRKHDEKKEIPDHLKLKRNIGMPFESSPFIKKKMPPLCEVNKLTGKPGPPLILEKVSGSETMPICVGDSASDQESPTSMESDEVMDLSLATIPNDKYLSRPRPDFDPGLMMTPPKKRRFDHQICDSNNPLIPVTLPPR